MNYFIKNIHINKLFHLENIDIPIANEKYPHLIITGKNGSGKTVLLNAIAEFLTDFKSFYLWEKSLELYQQNQLNSTDKADAMTNISNQIEWVFRNVNIKIGDHSYFVNKYLEGDFVITLYKAYRKPEMIEPKTPTKPEYNKKGNVKEIVTDQFLNFLSDLKIQEALARNEKQIQDADEIKNWFVEFEKLLQQIFQDEALKLEFNYKDYSFKICTEGKRFKFTELSDGFAAALDIVADLILKMQDKDSLTRAYEKEGIVLIDEIETHLHLSLQKIIMPLLTKVFPNIQFIVTTHSPFVLSSMPNAVAYDLEHQEVLEDLTEYSYESLAEGYFGVKTQSSYAEMQLNTLKELLGKEVWTEADKVEIKQLKSDFEKIPETISPLIVGEFRQVIIQYAEKLKNL